MYTPKTFNIPKLKGISEKTIEEHLKLYEGYVKNLNTLLEEGKNPKLGFEFDGMRNHEYYFSSFEGGPKEISNGKLKEMIGKQWDSFEEWMEKFKNIAKTRGVGWAILYYDQKEDRLLNTWVDEQHVGHLTGLKPILCLDMWEHSFVADYQPSGKGQYIDDFFENINWEVVEKNLIT